MSTSNADSRPVQLTTIDAARLLLERMGVSPADLLDGSAERAPVPVFADYIPRVAAAVGHGTRRVYSSYWNQVLNRWGPRSLAEVTALDISQFAEQTRASAIERRNSRGGRSAAEHMLAALRCVYRYAVADGIISEFENPALHVPKPRRLPSTRVRYRTTGLTNSAGSPREQETTHRSMLCCSGSMLRRRVGAVAL